MCFGKRTRHGIQSESEWLWTLRDWTGVPELTSRGFSRKRLNVAESVGRRWRRTRRWPTGPFSTAARSTARPGEFFARGERVLARYAPYAPPANPSVEEKKDDGGERDSDEPEGSVSAATEESEAGGWFLATVVRS